MAKKSRALSGNLYDKRQKSLIENARSKIRRVDPLARVYDERRMSTISRKVKEQRDKNAVIKRAFEISDEALSDAARSTSCQVAVQQLGRAWYFGGTAYEGVVSALESRESAKENPRVKRLLDSLGEETEAVFRNCNLG